MNSQKHFMKLPLYLIIVYLIASIPITIYIGKNTTQTKEYAHTNPSPTSQYVSPTFNCLANVCPTVIANPATYGKITPTTQNAPSGVAKTSVTPNPTSPNTSPTPATDPCKSSTNSVSTQSYTTATPHREHNSQGFLDFIMNLLKDLINIILQLLGLPPITSPAPNPIPGPSTMPCITNAPIPSLNPSSPAPSSPLQPSKIPTGQQPSTATSPSTQPTTQQPVATTTPPIAPAGWKLFWSDEFNGTSGSAVDSSKWTAEVGGHGWGNGEYEYYTNRTQNASMDGNGNLVITAIKENLPGSTCWYGACQYTSARLITKGKLDTQYGRIEVRAKAPYGQGIWPAFWTLGSNIDQVSWPASGEIDIMEMIGREPSINHGTIHNPNGGMGVSYTLPSGQKFADDFHTFAIEWSENNIKFFVDNNLYETRTNTNSPGTWAFNHPMFLLLNVAVGGQWPGKPDATTIFPQEMLVDYVRVYKQQ